MKVLILNGSPRVGGNTAVALDEMVKVFEKEGVETEVVFIGNKDIKEFISFVKNPDGTPHYENTYQYAVLRKEWNGGRV
jgi:multimeric flavodoxin WrbA